MQSEQGERSEQGDVKRVQGKEAGTTRKIDEIVKLVQSIRESLRMKIINSLIYLVLIAASIFLWVYFN